MSVCTAWPSEKKKKKRNWCQVCDHKVIQDISLLFRDWTLVDIFEASRSKTFLKYLKSIFQLFRTIQIQCIRQSKEETASPGDISNFFDDFHNLQDNSIFFFWAAASRGCVLGDHSHYHDEVLTFIHVFRGLQRKCENVVRAFVLKGKCYLNIKLQNFSIVKA